MDSKIIHYCWFGGKKKPKLIRKCIKSWKKYAPDYQIIEWNETNVDISSLGSFAINAYKAKKWAFVSDVVRFQKLYEKGGIYFDTDIELLKPIDTFIKESNSNQFVGFENDMFIAAGVIKSFPNDQIIHEILECYDLLSFDDDNIGSVTSPIIMTNVFKKHGLICDGQKQLVSNWTVFPFDYFYPYDHWKMKFLLTENSVCKHYYCNSWSGQRYFTLKVKRFNERVGKRLSKVFGKR